MEEKNKEIILFNLADEKLSKVGYKYQMSENGNLIKK